MPVFDTVLWDWNGTLLDDAALCCELLNTMLAATGAPVIDALAQLLPRLAQLAAE